MFYQSSDAIFPDRFQNLFYILLLEIDLDKMDSSIETAQRFFAIQPTSPESASDMIEMYNQHGKPEYLDEIFPLLEKAYRGESEPLGNIYFHWAKHLLYLEKNKDASLYLNKAKQKFKDVFQEDHQVFSVIEEMLAEIE